MGKYPSCRHVVFGIGWSDASLMGTTIYIITKVHLPTILERSKRSDKLMDTHTHTRVHILFLCNYSTCLLLHKRKKKKQKNKNRFETEERNRKQGKKIKKWRKTKKREARK